MSGPRSSGPRDLVSVRAGVDLERELGDVGRRGGRHRPIGPDSRHWSRNRPSQAARMPHTAISRPRPCVGALDGTPPTGGVPWQPGACHFGLDLVGLVGRVGRDKPPAPDPAPRSGAGPRPWSAGSGVWRRGWNRVVGSGGSFAVSGAGAAIRGGTCRRSSGGASASEEASASTGYRPDPCRNTLQGLSGPDLRGARGDWWPSAPLLDHSGISSRLAAPPKCGAVPDRRAFGPRNCPRQGWPRCARRSPARPAARPACPWNAASGWYLMTDTDHGTRHVPCC